MQRLCVICVALAGAACGENKAAAPAPRPLAAASPDKLEWLTDEAAAFKLARADGKGVMVTFSAVWCTPCAELEQTFGEDKVQAAIRASFVPLKFDVSESSDSNDERKARYESLSLPSVVFVGTDGIVHGRVTRVLEPDEALKVIEVAAHDLTAPAK